MMLRWLFWLCLMIVAHAAHAAHPHGPELGASAAMDASGMVWAVYKNDQHVMMRHSGDFGKTWSEPAPVNANPEPIGASGDARPKIAIGATGAILVTWTNRSANPTPARFVSRGR